MTKSRAVRLNACSPPCRFTARNGPQEFGATKSHTIRSGIAVTKVTAWQAALVYSALALAA
jgi:hypothetical protein